MKIVIERFVSERKNRITIEFSDDWVTANIAPMEDRVDHLIDDEQFKNMLNDQVRLKLGLKRGEYNE